MDNKMEQPTKSELIQKYLDSLNEKELQACKLAAKLLGMSFQIEKSIGYIKWYEKNYST